MNFATLCAIGVLFGIGFGFCAQRSGLCIAHGLGEIFVGRGKRILRLFLIIFIITSVGFFLSDLLHPDLGLRPVGLIRGHGFYNILSGILFGAGIFISGGCILGTLRQIGEGNMTFILTLLFFAPGMALMVHVINPFLEPGFASMNILLPDLLHVPALVVVEVSALLACLWLALVIRKKR